MALQALARFTPLGAAAAGEVVVRHRDYLKPDLAVEGTDQASDRGPAMQLYGEDALTPDEAKRLATLRAEQLEARARRCAGHGRVFGLAAGYRFSLTEHPSDGVDGDYLVTELSHYANQAADSRVREMLGLPYEDEYHVELEALEASMQYRPPLETPAPRISGLELARIDGEADSDYAQLDEHGRYNVRLMFDESDLGEGKASTRTRMAQPHGGEPEGWHLPLRKDTEVALSFVGGDPDRPVIVGVLPNAHTVSPVTSDNHTFNVIQTGGLNRWEMQDDKGNEYIDISTPPKDTRIHWGKPHGKHTHYIVDHTDGDCWIDIGGVRDIEIGGEQNEFVKRNVNETYNSNQKTKIGSKQEIDVTKNRILDICGPQAETVSGPVTETYDTSQKITITSTLDETAGPVTEEYASQKTTVTGLVDETFKTHTLTTGTRKIDAGATTHTYKSLTSTSGPPFTVSSLASATITATSVTIQVGTKKTNDSGDSWFNPLESKFTAASIELIAGLKMEGTANVGEIVAIKIGVTGAAVAFVGIDIQISALHLVLCGICKRASGGSSDV
jgi:type VI secretion system secreted protein VgrG